MVGVALALLGTLASADTLADALAVAVAVAPPLTPPAVDNTEGVVSELDSLTLVEERKGGARSPKEGACEGT